MDLGLTDSDWESFSDSGSSEHDVEFSYGGQAQNIFSSLEESIGKIDEFLSFGRGFMYDDIVRSITEPSEQTGRVININMSVDLESIHGKLVKEVDTNKLQKLRSISIGDYVINGPWLGRIDKIIDCVSIILDDGSKCEVLACDEDKLVAIPPNLLEDSHYSYYPGQRVYVKLSHGSKSTEWLCGNWRENRVEGTVNTVEAGLVYVDWVASTLMGSDQNLPSPPSLQDPKILTLLSCFSNASWQLGDWCILRSASCCDNDPKSPHGLSERGFERHAHDSHYDEVFVIVKTKMKIDVMWQDGSCSVGVDSQQLLPVGVVNAHEFWPDQFVAEKDICDTHRYGVVKVFNAKEQTVKVQWRRRVDSGCEEEETEEIVSAYELLEHPDFGFCFNDVVFRAFSEIKIDIPADTTAAYSDKKESDYPDTRYLSCIGVITGFKDGSVEVKWANGFTSEVAPYEIWKIEKSESCTSSTISLEENVQDSKQKGIHSGEEEPSENQQEKILVKSSSESENCSEHSSEYSSFFLPKAALGFITNIASSLFGSKGSTSLTSMLSSCHDSEDDQTDSKVLDEPNQGEVDMASRVHSKMDGKESNKRVNEVRFRQFDMVNDCSDHHFISSNDGLALSQVKRNWVKKVHQEWSILEADLPETIYVRAYEERMDLLRAAIVGAPGTPYHDGLFFFDILLPPQYPLEPPMVHYHSGGMRLNPNLYESGRVCLSLLNTWNGSGTEVWTPGCSSILQLLISLQALVLNEKPYFNEAGYDTQLGKAEGEKNSVSYNENAFLVTCKSIILSLRHPPKHFEELVKEHFTQRGQHVLSACRGYVEDGSVSSTGFKLMLSKLYPKLVEAFSHMGCI